MISVGEARRGEGAFELQRAFQLADVRTVVISLWEIPGAATRQLMTNFYLRMKTSADKAKLRHCKKLR